MNQLKNTIKKGGGKFINAISPFINCSGVIFLTYHEICDDNDPLFLGLPFEAFREQISFLHENYSLISFDEALFMLEKGHMKGLHFAITFDDGFRNNAKAFEFLKSFHIKPALFVSVNAVDRKEVFWFKKLEIALKKEDQFFGYLQKKCLEDALHYLKSIPLNLRQKIIDDFLVSEFGSGSFNLASEVFTWEELRQLALDKQIVIGSHGMQHESLKFMDKEEIKKELILSRATIKKRTNINVDAYAFPNGAKQDIPEGVEDILYSCGYRYVFSLINGINKTYSFPIKRICISRGFSHQYLLFDKDIFTFNLIKSIFM